MPKDMGNSSVRLAKNKNISNANIWYSRCPKVLEEDSLLEAYANMHLGGIILFEKN